MKFDYMYFENIFTVNECLEINNVCKNNLNSMYDLPAKDVKKSSNINFIFWKNIKNKINAIENYIKISNENFKFDIFDVKDDNYLAYNTYSEKNKSEYGWHSDLNKGNNNHFKLTVLLNISTVNYVGGFFELFLNKPIHVKQFDKTGCMLIFPTYLQHRVTPVIQGERNTLALWLEGPRFK